MVLILIERRRGANVGLAILLSIIAAAGLARASHPLATDDTGTLGAGVVELELSMLGQRPTSAPLGQLDVALAVHVGVLGRLDIGASFGYQLAFGDDGQHLLPPVLDLKVVLRRGDTLGVSLRVDYTPPFSGALSSGGHDLGGVVVVSWSRRRLQLSLNGGVIVTRVCCPGESSTTLVGAAAVTITLGKLLLAGEAVATGSPWNGALQIAPQVGAAYNFAANHWLSMGAGPLYERGSSVGASVTVGLTLTLGSRS